VEINEKGTYGIERVKFISCGMKNSMIVFEKWPRIEATAKTIPAQ
jgi:hypothetical protein